MDVDALLSRGVAEVIVESELRARLANGRPLRLKMGFDPSKPDLHVGHAVGLRKLRQLQDLGHTVVLIVGDWTAQIGDPSGRDESRTMLSPDQVNANAETYMQQFFSIVDRGRTEVRRQTEWFGNFTLADVFNLTARFTMQQLMAHETFRKRWDEGKPLTMMELMYPLLQAYDSVAIQADVEFGGTDQKFNILAGRELMASLGMVPQQVLLVPLLPGTDGRKMSKSFGNTIDLITPAPDAYGRVMRLADEMIIPYLWNVTDVPAEEVHTIQAQLLSGQVNPRDAKMRVAREIVTMLHGLDAAAAAEEHYVRTISQREIPDAMPDFAISAPMSIVDLLATAGLASSKSEARRLIDGGGVRLDGARVEQYDLAVFPDPDGAVVQVGRRKFVRVRLAP